MGVRFLGELINKGFLKIVNSEDRRQEVVDLLKRTDLAITQMDLVAEELAKSCEAILVRPALAGNFNMQLQPNYFQRTKDSFDNKEVLSKRIGVGVDELVPVEVLGSSIKDGTVEENYRILLNQEGRNNPYLTVQSYYKTIEI